jgi:hypothetical protein
MRTRVAVLLMMVVMPAAPALANNGNKGWDGEDKNLGGGQEHPKNQHYKNGQY